MAYGTRKIMKDIIRQLEKQGWSCSMTRSSHWRLQSPTGDIVHTGSTPGEGRAIQNLNGQLLKAGAVIK